MRKQKQENKKNEIMASQKLADYIIQYAHDNPNFHKVKGSFPFQNKKVEYEIINRSNDEK